MKLYLVRHGEYVHPSIDSSCPLSNDGIANIRMLAEFLSEKDISPQQIVHSGKTRAQQSADILADHGGFAATPELLEGLKPNDPVGAIALFLMAQQSDTMIVGHLPFLSLLTSLLLHGAEDAQGLPFAEGTCVSLTRRNDTWSLDWISHHSDRSAA